MTTHASRHAGLSQADKILAELQRQSGRWVSMLVLHQVSGSMAVHSRIADLRTLGHVIHQRNERKGRTVHSYYRLQPRTEQLPLGL